MEDAGTHDQSRLPRAVAHRGFAPITDAPDGAYLCVLASGSAGNCSVLALRRGSVTRLCLIDLGLSPRRTFRCLIEMGFRPDQIDHAILTHLDTDHFQPNWLAMLPGHARMRMHKRHYRDLAKNGFPSRAIPDRIKTFDGPFNLEPGVTVRPMLMEHDEHGVTTLRFDMSEFGAGVLGFATDVGRVTMELVDHFRADHGGGPGVDVLAIESNYCPKMQLESDRPAFLKRRIMGGKGHLSNQETVEAIGAIRPREHVVLLHLSRQCNDPRLVAGMHKAAGYTWTISDQFTPTPWVRIAPGPRREPRPVVSSRLFQTATLWTQSHP